MVRGGPVLSQPRRERGELARRCGTRAADGRAVASGRHGGLRSPAPARGAGHFFLALARPR